MSQEASVRNIPLESLLADRIGGVQRTAVVSHSHGRALRAAIV